MSEGVVEADQDVLFVGDALVEAGGKDHRVGVTDRHAHRDKGLTQNN